MRKAAADEPIASRARSAWAQLAQRALQSPTLMSWLSMVARIGSNAALVFLIAIKFKPAEISILFFLLTISNLYFLADLGLGPLFVRLFAHAFGGSSLDELTANLKNDNQTFLSNHDPNWSTIATVFYLQHVFFIGIALAALFIGGVAGSWLLLPLISRLASPLEGWGAWAVVLISSTVILGGKTYSNFLLGCDRIAIQKKYETLLSTVAAVGGVLCVFFAPNLVVISAIYFGVPVLSVLVTRHIANRVHGGQLALSRTDTFEAGVARALWPQTWRMSIGILLSQVVLNFSSLLVTRSAEPLIAAQLLFSLRLIRILDTFSAAPITVTLPSMVRLHLQGNSADFATSIERTTLLSISVIIFPGLLIAIFGQGLLNIIHSRVELLPTNDWLLLVAAAALMRYGAVHLQFVTIQNKVLWHIANGISGTLFLGSLLIATRFLTAATAYAFAYFIGASLFYAPYSVVNSYRMLKPEVRRRDMLIAIALFGVLVAGSMLLQVLSRL